MKKRTLIQAAAVALTSIAWAGPALAQDLIGFGVLITR